MRDVIKRAKRVAMPCTRPIPTLEKVIGRILSQRHPCTPSIFPATDLRSDWLDHLNGFEVQHIGQGQAPRVM